MSTREGFGEEQEKCLQADGIVAVEGEYNGPERRRTDFDGPASKLFRDAAQLIAKAEEMSAQKGEYVHPYSLIRRKDDDVDKLKRAINWKVLGYGLFGDRKNDPDLKK
jgi:hypothetical protein